MAKRLRTMYPFDYINYLFMLFLMFITLYPFWYILVISVSTQAGYYLDRYHLIPRTFTLSNYKFAFTNSSVFTGFMNSVVVTACGVAVNIILTSMGAYALSKDYLRGRDFFLKMIIFTMFFSGGLIPLYILISKLGLKDSLLVLIIPTALNTFNLILIRNYFRSAVPSSLEDSAKIEGCNDMVILIRIVFPVSLPIIATISLFVAVAQWNDWFMPMLYISSAKKTTLAQVLRNMVVQPHDIIYKMVASEFQIPAIFKATAIMISIVPIMLIYPFIQKYFVKGIILGAVKG